MIMENMKGVPSAGTLGNAGDDALKIGGLLIIVEQGNYSHTSPALKIKSAVQAIKHSQATNDRSAFAPACGLLLAGQRELIQISGGDQ